MINSRFPKKKINSLLHFLRKNIKKSILTNNSFLNKWFLNKSKINVYTFLIKNKITAVNFYILNKCIYNKKKYNFLWSSALYSNKEGQEKAAAVALLSKMHNEHPIVGCICPNKNSLKFNKFFGREILGLKLKRFIFFYNKVALTKILKKKIDLNFFIKKNKFFERKQFLSKWTKHIPQDYNKLWTSFSKKFDLIVVKDLKYIRNRYYYSFLLKYRFLEIRKKKELVGFVILRVQKVKKNNYIRVVDFFSKSGYEKFIWSILINKCIEFSPGFIDFFCVGTSQNYALKKNNFFDTSAYPELINVPNLLSPISYRQWSDYFHIGGFLKNKIKLIDSSKVLFTKGDGDRDWPTLRDLK